MESSKSLIKYPLSIFIVWHPNFNRGKEIAEKLYSLFCRNPENPLESGLGIPVYYRSKVFDETNKPKDINFDSAKKNAIILLIDENFILDSNFLEYSTELRNISNENNIIYPMSFHKDSYEILNELSSLQFIRCHDFNLENEFNKLINKIKNELFNDIAKLLTKKNVSNDEAPPKIKMFLSHAKKDGLHITQKFKQYVQNNTKINVFFDALDIADGYDFETQLKLGVQESVLVVFHTDEYSSREWCRIEVLVAKQNKCSIIVVHDIKNGEKRAFPYLGNIPTITLKNDENESFTEIIFLALYKHVSNLFNKELLNIFKTYFDENNYNFISLSSSPELFDYIDINKKKNEKKNIVLYPEPPLGKEELKILNEFDPNISFITPINLFSFDKKEFLKDKKIAISISETEELDLFGMSEYHLKDIFVEISRYLIVNGSKLIYGGDLRTKGYTKLLSEISYQYKYLNDKEEKVTNYFHYPLSKNLNNINKIELKKNQVEIKPLEKPNNIIDFEIKDNSECFKDVEYRFFISECLHDMRNKIIDNCDIRIILGGRQTGFLGYYPGVLEETYLALRSEKPLYLIGGFGGVAKSVISLIKGKIPKEMTNDFHFPKGFYKDFKKYVKDKSSIKVDYGFMVKEIKKHSIENISSRNGLSKEENEILFESTNIHEIVFLIIKGLQNIYK